MPPKKARANAKAPAEVSSPIEAAPTANRRGRKPTSAIASFLSSITKRRATKVTNAGDASSDANEQPLSATVPKRKPGRPRKGTATTPATEPKRRGRPPKTPRDAATTPKRKPGRPARRSLPPARLSESEEPRVKRKYTRRSLRPPGRPRKNPSLDVPPPASVGKKRRGRPPKTPKTPTTPATTYTGKKRGRPRKNPQAPSPVVGDRLLALLDGALDAQTSSEVEERQYVSPRAAGRTNKRAKMMTPASPRGGRGGRRGGAVDDDDGGVGGVGPGGYLADAFYEGDADSLEREGRMDAVVKVFCTHTEPNYSLPWQRKRQSASTSSGFVIPGRRVLTNAHSVEHHTQVKLKKRGSDVKYVAKVLAIGVECDLALLTVEDDDFFEGIAPVQFGPLPHLSAPVSVIGYPIGGVAISITSGVVSRTEVTNYAHGGIDLLGVQIDAAINSGNSGGPAFNSKGECVGVAFQSLKHDDAENIGYVIPTPVIHHFITDYDRNKTYTGFPSLPFSWQRVESPAMRKWLKMRTGQKGVLISAVEPLMKDKINLKKNDVLVSIDGTDIASDGTVPFRAGEPITFNYLVSEKYVGESAQVRYLRDGKMQECSITFNAMKRLVPWHIEGTPPSYFIAGGLVFTTVCVPFLKNEYGKDYDFDAPVKLLEKFCHGRVEEEGQQVVICAQVLAAEVNRGYEDLHNTIVQSFNGVKIFNLKQLAQAVESSKDEFMRFELDHEISVVMDTKAANSATKAILKTHAIPSAKSADLR